MESALTAVPEGHNARQRGKVSGGKELLSVWGHEPFSSSAAPRDHRADLLSPFVRAGLTATPPLAYKHM